MNFDSLMRRLRNKKFWFSWIGITIGSLILAAGFVLFTNPYQIIPGGVYGLGRILHHVFPAIQTGTFGLMLDIPLMIAGFMIFGKMFGAKTIYSALLIPVFMNGMTLWLGENPADGVSVISRHFDLSDNVLMAAIFGGVFIGIGMGTILKFGATSGGTDIIEITMAKYLKMRFSTALFIVESTIVIIGMVVLQDWKLPLFSLISIFVSTKTLDFALDGGTYDKLLFIISDKKEELKDYILNEMERGGTYIKSKGMYTDRDKDMIFLVVSKREITEVQDKIKEIDVNSFVVVVNAYETFGDGFKQFPEEKSQF